ncbi:hypothetical protein F511_23665 [Dorcoceras hygrometricum]|uniref:Uncharacterized protein n=1 Tax=Dorcoceras hygrometricum TaxID=472368 RepID=A0A2Z7D425_9LAMI|nr:hypothetical protein F511_23665 [Dorcoceras hygrometricum]
MDENFELSAAGRSKNRRQRREDGELNHEKRIVSSLPQEERCPPVRRGPDGGGSVERPAATAKRR